ncbi:gp23 [Propionibacterium phage PA6]|uniref:Gp23 n=1 Tax=Propionibacterium phage PA6 TaxID=376758 RepID=A4K490_9CAUD|nr:gp23 [Propionibacterium phage PA6]ABE68592.1 gp23 [Propionibacterium phage PA6]
MGCPALSHSHRISLHSSSVSWSIARSSRLTLLTVRFTLSREMGTPYWFSTPSTMFSNCCMLVGCCWTIRCIAVLRVV